MAMDASNSPAAATQFDLNFVELQLSFSTAEIEKMRFYGPEEGSGPAPSGQQQQFLVVHGEYFELIEGAPQGASQFSEEDPLLRLNQEDA